jgi:hypothetical protein
MFVHTAPTNWSKNPTQRITERALFMLVEVEPEYSRI